jgi:hypothetical protein
MAAAGTADDAPARLHDVGHTSGVTPHASTNAAASRRVRSGHFQPPSGRQLHKASVSRPLRGR